MNKVILVGASKSLLTSKLGKVIDSYDIVCRMNNGGRPELLNGKYKNILGTKRNIWLCKHVALLNMFHNNHGYNNIVGFAQFKGAKHFPKTIQKNFSEGYLILEKTIKALENFNVTSTNIENTKNRPSCGILSIFYLLEKYNKIHICGMDGFKGGHWYGNMFLSHQEQSDKIAAKGFGAHNAIKEQEYINYLIQNGKIKKIDE